MSPLLPSTSWTTCWTSAIVGLCAIWQSSGLHCSSKRWCGLSSNSQIEHKSAGKAAWLGSANTPQRTKEQPPSNLAQKSAQSDEELQLSYQLLHPIDFLFAVGRAYRA